MVHQQTNPSIIAIIFSISSYSRGSNCEGNNYGRWGDCYKMPIKE